MSALPAARLPELVRRGAGLLTEEPGEMGGIGECEIVGDLVNRLTGEYELALGFGEHALADEVTGGDTGGAPDMIVEPIDRHRKLVGIEGELPLLLEMLLHQLAQRVDGCAGRF